MRAPQPAGQSLLVASSRAFERHSCPATHSASALDWHIAGAVEITLCRSLGMHGAASILSVDMDGKYDVNLTSISRPTRDRHNSCQGSSLKDDCTQTQQVEKMCCSRLRQGLGGTLNSPGSILNRDHQNHQEGHLAMTGSCEDDTEASSRSV